MNRVQGSATVMKDTMSGKIMMEGVDSVMDRERVATDVVNENEEQGRVLAEVERDGIG